MSETQRNRTTPRPTRTSIVVMAAITALVLAATAWVTTGPVFDSRHLVGACVGLMATIMLASQTVGRVVEYNQPQPLTGVWVKIGLNKSEEVEVTIEDWADRAELLRVLTELEQEGYQPVDREGTLRMRRELGMPEWSR